MACRRGFLTCEAWGYRARLSSQAMVYFAAGRGMDAGVSLQEGARQRMRGAPPLLFLLLGAAALCR